MPDFFPQRPASHPMIYAYEDTNPQYTGLLKVGYTTIEVDKRVAQQYPTKRPDGSVPYRIVYRESAMYPDGTSFTDHDVHRALERMGIISMGGEWYRCTTEDVRAAVLAVRTRTDNIENRTETFAMRPEQAEAVERTVAYYQSVYQEGSGRTPKFLWNAKMRFGKTFAAYQLAKQMGFSRVLVLTFKPAVQSAWREDLMRHIDFEGWQFIARDSSDLQNTLDVQYHHADMNRPIVCFGSFQDFLGVNRETGGIKANNEWVHTTNWDLVIFDEYHFGAWKDSAKKLFEQDEDSYDEDLSKYDRGNACDETWLPITTDYYLYLSGTPFRALNSGEFIEEQIYNWTYSDEQRAKEQWVGENNPYAALPRMVLLTYRVPESIQRIAKQGEFDEFDLNVFFSTTGKGNEARFIYEDHVQKWLDLIRGAYLEATIDDLKQGAKKPPMPYSHTELLNVLNHTLWFLPNVAACEAMANLLARKQNIFYHNYKVTVCAGPGAGIGLKALEPVRRSMADPLASKTITLSCGKLTTGVTIRPWTGIFMLRNLSSPETYFQAAFRVQSPWEITNDNGQKEIVKQQCYVFDFALNRALRQISDYSCRLNVTESNPEKKVAEFIKFLPVLAYDGSGMRPVNAAEILDIAMAGTTATLLAKRWESALLVNVDNETLARLLANQDAMAALQRIEGFRNLNADIETIINKSESVKKAKKEGDNLTPKQKKELTEDEKEYKSKRKMIQEKLIKFATRVPVFMYLTDFRENSLRDVITQLEPELFKKVTGLDVKDFELLVSLNVFNESLMNDAVYKFKRYEDASLSYTGVDRHAGENVGLYSTVVSRMDYDAMAGLLDDSMQLGNQPTVNENIDVSERTDQVGRLSYSKTREQQKQPVPAEAERANTHAISKDTNSAPSEMRQNVQTHIPASDSQRPCLTPTYRPAFVPPEVNPVQAPAKKEVDVSGVKVGTVVRHKAFGEGTVCRMEPAVLWISFNGEEKRFAFPSAFQDGFLATSSENGAV